MNASKSNLKTLTTQFTIGGSFLKSDLRYLLEIHRN